jgi:tRNA (cytidine/uridine-2'-O-)-methyltransferase
MRLALYQPDIPQNLGAAIRLGACLAVPLDVIEPCGFPISDKSLRRAAMDYGEIGEMARHDSWDRFLAAPERAAGRLVLFTTKGAIPHVDFIFQPGDTLLFGRESAGVPPQVHARADARVFVPIAAGTRSLNLATAAALALAEGLRQTTGFPRTGFPPS